MNNIELICPTCEEMLEIDSGFAGGVCRCFHCGTLMTVPGGLGPQRPKRVTRPDRPERPTPQPAPEINARNLPPETVIFKTEDGREVRLAAGQTIPTAHTTGENPLLRRGIIAVAVLSVIAAVTIGLIYSSWFSSAPAMPTTPTRQTTPRATGPLDPSSSANGSALTGDIEDHSDQDESSAGEQQQSASPVAEGNPYLLESTQFLGFSLRGRVVIAVDASASSSPWIELVKQAVVRGVRSPRMLQVVCQRGEFTWIYPSSPGLFKPEEADAWRSFLADAQPEGDMDFFAVESLVTRSLAAKPRQLILVLGPTVAAADLQSIAALNVLGPDFTLDLVTIDHDSDAAGELAKRHGWRYRSLSSSQLQTWHAQAAAGD